MPAEGTSRLFSLWSAYLLVSTWPQLKFLQGYYCTFVPALLSSAGFQHELEGKLRVIQPIFLQKLGPQLLERYRSAVVQAENGVSDFSSS